MRRVGRAGSIGLALVALVVLASCAAPAPWTPPQPSPGSLTVMSFNIRHGVGTDNLLDLDRIARVITTSGAELVGLQEVDRHFGARSNFVDQATYLAGVLGMDVAFGANLDLDPLAPGQPRRQYGNAILTRHRITAQDNTLLPRLATSEQRGLLHVTVDVHGTPVEAYATHLQVDSPAERSQQVAAILGIIGTPDASVVLLGDLNATPDTPEVAAMVDQLTDAWAAAGVGDGNTFSSQTPTTRIDYVLTSRDVTARAAAVIASDASDHRPVVASLALPGSVPPAA